MSNWPFPLRGLSVAICIVTLCGIWLVVKNHNLHRTTDEQHVRRMILRGGAEELQQLQAIHGIGFEQVQYARACMRLQEEAHETAARDFMHRELYGPPPTSDELAYGEYVERLDPPVREAVFALRRKGYAVESAGVCAAGTQQYVQFDKEKQLTAAMLGDLPRQCFAAGVLMEDERDKLVLRMQRALTLAECADIWKRVAAHAPDTGHAAPPRLGVAAERFRAMAEQPCTTIASADALQEIFREGLAAARRVVDHLDNRTWSALSDVHTLLHDEDARAVMLILAGLKPATTLYASHMDTPVVLQTLASHGLAVAAREAVHMKGDVVDVFVAANADVLARLLRIQGKRAHREYGALMGYPETATEAFVNGTALRTFPTDINPDMVKPTMRLSRTHWPLELQRMATWSYCTKLITERLAALPPGM